MAPNDTAPISTLPIPTVSLTLTGAADATGVSKTTLRRKLDAGEFPNAFRKDGKTDGVWLVPVTDLEFAGLTLSAPSEPTIDIRDGAPADPSAELIAAKHALELENAKLSGDAARWRAVAEERDRTISGFEMAFKALPPAPKRLDPSVPAPTGEPAPTLETDRVVTDPPPRRSWWRRQKMA